MTELGQRLIPAGLLALILHGVALSWHMQQDQVTLPAPLAIQRIAVSLGARPAVREPPPAPEQKPEKKQEVVQQPKPEPNPPEPRPVTKPEVQPVSKPQPIQEQEIVTLPVSVDPPQETQIIAADAPPPPHTEIGDERDKADTAAHVTQQATPLYQVNPPPQYPRLARRRGFEGVVLLEALIDALGRVKDLQLSSSSGHSVLDRAALKSVRRWRFSPGTVNGRSEEMWVKVPVRFQLKET